MAKRKIYFRADGNSNMGLGHVFRSLALVDMLKAEFDCHFIIREPLAELKKQLLQSCNSVIEIPETNNHHEEAQQLCEQYFTADDIVVLDGYHFQTAYQQTIKNKGCKLVCIDDIHACHFVADIVINHAPGINPSEYKIETYTKLCQGLKYALLRSPFLEAAKEERNIEHFQNVFICFGGSDSYNLSYHVAQALSQLGSIFKSLHIVLGAANSNFDVIHGLNDSTKVDIQVYQNLSAQAICDLMKSCQLAVVPASSILYEVLSVKMPVLSGYYVDNQKSVFRGFEQLNVIYPLGDLRAKDTDYEQISQQIQNQDSIADFLAKQQKLNIDQAATNLLQLFNKLSDDE